jgi:hypothetical protein
MGRGKEYTTKEYILRTIQYADDTWTDKEIIKYIQKSFDKARNISERSIYKALSILKRSGIVINESRVAMKFKQRRQPENRELFWAFFPSVWLETRVCSHVIDWKRVSELITRKEMETFIEAMKERGHTMNQEEQEALNEYLDKKRELRIKQSKEMNKNEARWIEDAGRYCDIIQLYNDEQNARKALEAFKIWKKLELEKGETLATNLS